MSVQECVARVQARWLLSGRIGCQALVSPARRTDLAFPLLLRIGVAPRSFHECNTNKYNPKRPFSTTTSLLKHRAPLPKLQGADAELHNLTTCKKELADAIAWHKRDLDQIQMTPLHSYKLLQEKIHQTSKAANRAVTAVRAKQQKRYRAMRLGHMFPNVEIMEVLKEVNKMCADANAKCKELTAAASARIDASP